MWDVVLYIAGRLRSRSSQMSMRQVGSCRKRDIVYRFGATRAD